MSSMYVQEFKEKKQFAGRSVTALILFFFFFFFKIFNVFLFFFLMGRGLFLKVNGCPVFQAIPRILWNLKVHYGLTSAVIMF